MNNRNQQHSNRPSSIQLTPSPAPPQSTGQTHTHLNVFTVEEYENNGKTQKSWTRIGTAFPHKEGPGFSIELRALPLDGRLVILPPDQTDDRSK